MAIPPINSHFCPKFNSLIDSPAALDREAAADGTADGTAAGSTGGVRLLGVCGFGDTGCGDAGLGNAGCGDTGSGDIGFEDTDTGSGNRSDGESGSGGSKGLTFAIVSEISGSSALNFFLSP